MGHSRCLHSHLLFPTLQHPSSSDDGPVLPTVRPALPLGRQPAASFVCVSERSVDSDLCVICVVLTLSGALRTA